jgi:glycosyltransferase involved in cell wall biosynthesis
MLELCLELRARGHDVGLACPEPPPGEDSSLLARARAADLSPCVVLDRAKGIGVWRDAPDVARMRAALDTRDVEIVHAWHSRDHALALRAAHGRRRKGRTRLVRSYKSAVRIPRWPWNRWWFGPGCDGLVCVSPESAARNAGLRGGRPIVGSLGGVDLTRFHPADPPPALRASLGLDADALVVGIVARAQRHRRFDLLLEAAAQLFEREPRARLLVIGRGTHIQETAVAPAERLGIADRVVFAGYRSDDYVDVLRCADVFTFLVPGSDGGCRALLEATACGIPAVTSRRGALPEIVDDGNTGLLVDETPASLAAGFAALVCDAERRRSLGAAARARAEACFGRGALADAVTGLYAEVLGAADAPAR